MTKVESLDNGVKMIILDISKVDSTTIVDNTANTWQENRSEEEKARDTNQGKLAEIAFEVYIKTRADLIYFNYDSFRSDDSLKHAPLDGFFLSNDNVFQDKIIQIINKDVSESKYGKLWPRTRTAIRSMGGRTVEIKSTKVAARHNNGAKSPLEISNRIILSDDFLSYPRYLRKSNDIATKKDYLEFSIATGKLTREDLWLENEKEVLSDILVRIYIDQQYLYIIGYLTAEDFLKEANIKKMPKFDKSEHALYLACPLKNRSLMDGLNVL